MNPCALSIFLLCTGLGGAGGSPELVRGVADDGSSAASLCAIHQLNHDYERAVRACSDALAEGEDAELYSNRGSALLMLDDIDRAILDFDRAIQLEPDNAIRYYNRGIAFGKKHEGQKAIDDYSEAIRLHPDLAPAYGNRAREFELAGDHEKAIADYRITLRLAPALKSVLEGSLRRLGAH
jgi:tetratricopeptide (TPR) repeat protein